MASECDLGHIPRFPRDFVWGAATAAFQIEGAAKEGGRGPSIWDTFAAIPGNVLDNDNGDFACDHFHRSDQDVDLLDRLGIPHYRFSISWPRVQPDGKTVEPRGLAFYDRLADRLAERGIVPIATLYHWDLPQSLQDEGGWPNRDTAARLADYAELVFDRLSDRVRQWVTINEPYCSAFFGYGNGMHAPGISDHRAALRAAHHLMLAHGTALRRLREKAEDCHKFGIALNFAPAVIETADEGYQQAARKFDRLQNRFFLDAVLGRGYPAEFLADVAHLDALQPAIADGDLETIAAPLDWLGINYYAPCRPAPLAEAKWACDLPGLDSVGMLPAPGPLTSMGWEQAPDQLTRLLLWLTEYCRDLPLIVAENGAAFPDTVGACGHVHDSERVRYYVEHLAAVHNAIEQGAKVEGYLAWSLLDNFEWAMGYSQRFGVVHVDFATQERRIKDSGWLLAEAIRTNAVPDARHFGNGCVRR
ncbi:GH1 family beta-glucosidase [Amycolatopsis sp. NPDC059090]|uniref:GH1 family beta-glucosidase n=1 Tax=unclassified Amycolatopsis TaxID=2618356 RepID=UPI00366A8B7E